MSTETQVKVEEITSDDLDNLLGTPGADQVITGAEGAAGNPEKPGFFQKEKVDMSAFDDNQEPEKKEEEEEEEEENDEIKAAKAAAAAKALEEEEGKDPGSFDKLVDDLEDDDEKNKGGRPKVDKGGMAQLTQTLLDDKIILPFSDDKKLEDYTADDFKELFQMNFEEQKKQIESNTPKEFFESLPNELQYAAKYVADGGQDLKGLFRALATSEEAKAIDIATERGQETVVRSYLQAQNFGDDTEIQEEIDSWKDLDKLEAKARQFKPKLDKMQEQVVQRQIKEQEAKKAQQQDASLQYANSIYDALEPGELNGLKMSKKVQSMLYNGLIKPSYQSANGQNTNLFGHLIEQHQFVKPNHGLIAEALWLLADPEGYKKELSKGVKNEQVEDTVRKLKTEQASKNGNTTDTGKEDTGAHSRGKTIERPKPGFFKR